MIKNGISSVHVITSMQRAKGLIGQPNMASGNPLDKNVVSRQVAPTMSLGSRRHLFSMKAVLLIVSRPTMLSMNIMQLPLMKARLSLSFNTDYRSCWEIIFSRYMTWVFRFWCLLCDLWFCDWKGYWILYWNPMFFFFSCVIMYLWSNFLKSPLFVNWWKNSSLVFIECYWFSAI